MRLRDGDRVHHVQNPDEEGTIQYEYSLGRDMYVVLWDEDIAVDRCQVCERYLLIIIHPDDEVPL